MVEIVKKPKSRKTGNNWLTRQRRLDNRMPIYTEDGRQFVKVRVRPNKERRIKPRKDQWKCVCGCWNPVELEICDHCKRNKDGVKIEQKE
jgi:hypothetical protein